jgi:hypothetical protein
MARFEGGFGENKAMAITMKTKGQREAIYSHMRAACTKALRELAREHGLKVVHAYKNVDVDDLIGNEMGIGMSIRAGHVILGKRGYISNRPHGDSFHRDFEPGWGSDNDWNQFFDHPCLSYVSFSVFPSGDNFDPQNKQDVIEAMKLINTERDPMQEELPHRGVRGNRGREVGPDFSRQGHHPGESRKENPDEDGQ